MVELARALAPSPRLLLLDEPASGLSEEQRQRLAALLVTLGRPHLRAARRARPGPGRPGQRADLRAVRRPPRLRRRPRRLPFLTGRQLAARRQLKGPAHERPCCQEHIPEGKNNDSKTNYVQDGRRRGHDPGGRRARRVQRRRRRRLGASANSTIVACGDEALSGVYAQIGETDNWGAEAYFKYIDAHGGILGHQVKYIYAEQPVQRRAVRAAREEVHPDLPRAVHRRAGVRCGHRVGAADRDRQQDDPDQPVLRLADQRLPGERAELLGLPRLLRRVRRRTRSPRCRT